MSGCTFGFHHWSKWSDMERVVSGTFFASWRQVRSCERCNKAKVVVR